MQPRLKLPMTVTAAVILLTCCLTSSGEEDTSQQFPSIGERRMDLVAEKIESLGCVLDKKAILDTKDGDAIVFKHLQDPKGDVSVTFNHLVMPAGNWILCGAKNSTVGEKCEDAPETSPVRREAVSAVVSGRAINATPRTLDDSSTYSMVYVDLRRIWEWDIRVAHSWTSKSAVHGFGYDVPEGSKTERKNFKNHQLPIVNILHFDEKDALLAGALYWFEKQGEGGAGQPATAPESKPEGKNKRKPESEVRPQ